jgi:hypothetical protein
VSGGSRTSRYASSSPTAASRSDAGAGPALLAGRLLLACLVLWAWLLLVHPPRVADSLTLIPPRPRAAPNPGSAQPRLQLRRPAPFSPAPIRSLLTWPGAGASFYDVILWRNGERVLDLWPTTARVTLPEHWRFHGKRFNLADGPYLWFVYPATGTRASARYRPLAAHGTIAAR